MHLPAAGGIKSRAVEEHSVVRVNFRGGYNLSDFTFEIVEERVVIIEPVRHTVYFIVRQRRGGIVGMMKPCAAGL